MSPEPYPWSIFRRAMSDLAARNETRCSRLYRLVEAYDAFVGFFLDRPHGLDSSRPQDYLACVLLVRSFRLMVGGLWLSASGYPDLSPNLGRTIWEIGVRLFYSQKDPAAAALGFFIHADRRQLESMEAELAHRRSRGEDVGNLPGNCQNVREHRAQLETIARAKGIDVASAVSTFGQLNVRQACGEIGIEKAYLVDYAFDSGHVHERNLTTDSFLSMAADVGQYELGPTDSDDTWATTFDLLRNFGFVAGAAAILAEDRTAEALAESLHRDLFQARGEERRGV